MAAVTYRHPDALASPQWLADHLEDPSVRVVDARFDLRATSEGCWKPSPNRTPTARLTSQGAVFIDVMGDLPIPGTRSSLRHPTGSRPSWAASGSPITTPSLSMDPP